MKSKYILLMSLFMIFSLSACKTTETTKTTTQTSQSTTQATTALQPIENECDQAAAVATDNWVPVWCDEFDYEGQPHSSKWTLENKGDGFGNNELQYYTQRSSNSNVTNGELTITLKKEQFSGRDYTSAKLISRSKGDFLYGKFEVRAKLPQGKGTWPAIWMMPTVSNYGGWPNSGEIDIMEHVGYDMNRIHGTVHTGNYNHKMGTQVGKSKVISDVVNTYHTYTIEWDPTGIQWFIDGVKYHEFKNDETMNPNNSTGNWPFDQEFYLILNVAFGGDWGGAQGIDPNFTQSRMIVDYVRVYQKDYEAIDKQNPADVTGYTTISDLPYKTKISWNQSQDDSGISHYEVSLDGESLGKTAHSSYLFTNLEPNTAYEIIVTAVDFAGKKANPTTYSFTTGGFVNIPTVIKASDYIEMSGIQLENTSDTGGGKNVGYIDLNDYLVYKINVSDPGTYKVKYRVASQSNGGAIKLLVDDALINETTFSATGGWQSWRTEESATFTLDSGIKTIKLVANKDGFNINWIEFVKVN